MNWFSRYEPFCEFCYFYISVNLVIIIIDLLQLLEIYFKVSYKAIENQLNFAKQLIPKAKISGSADYRLDNFSKDALI